MMKCDRFCIYLVFIILFIIITAWAFVWDQDLLMTMGRVLVWFMVAGALLGVVFVIVRTAYKNHDKHIRK